MYTLCFGLLTNIVADCIIYRPDHTITLPTLRLTMLIQETVSWPLN